ncbi:MAG: A/G-specific adenine glycosylase, partial [Methylocystis sp.]|nr:A/G-specific adenine glycosylase [Methylocystis sp.]
MNDFPHPEEPAKRASRRTRKSFCTKSSSPSCFETRHRSRVYPRSDLRCPSRAGPTWGGAPQHEGEGAAERLLAWYDRNRRDLPWRAPPGETPDPYAVWLSEIMLQQTTVAAAKPYFAAFLSRWPHVEALAKAPLDEAMKAWAGLGYYARARNMHACAGLVATKYRGRFPTTELELRELPGVGPYTAAAIAAVAFNRPAIVVDGNIQRVVARLFAVSEPPRQARTRIAELLASLLSPERPGDFAQGLMDLGAGVCTARAPSCGACPFAGACEAARRGEAEAFPVKAPRT